MNRRELDLLERAFAAEIDAAVGGGIPVIQTRSKLAKQLMNDGYLRWCEVALPGFPPVVVEGYALTLLGNLTYCTSERCADEDDAAQPSLGPSQPD